MAFEHLTKEFVTSRVTYDPQTGIFLWNYRSDLNSPRACASWNAQYAGREAGSFSKKYGYIELLATFAHRVAFVLMTGNLPKNVVDHINGDKTDNRWCNLRDVSSRANAENRRSTAPHRALPLGVTAPSRLAHQKNPYRAVIRISGRSAHIGYFPTPEEAHQAYLEVKRRHHAGCTI